MIRILQQSIRPVIIGVLAFALSSSYCQDGWAQDPGEQVFQSVCIACHTIGGGRLVGPDLLGVHDRRSQEWLESFVRSSQSMIASGDADAIALFEEFNHLPMPDPPISEQQIRQVLSYIQAQSTGQAKEGASAERGTLPEAEAEATMAGPEARNVIQMGQELFQGDRRLVNNGPACNACHEVRNDAVIGGGILAKELTAVFSRMGGAGVKAILGQAPFPVMQAAYENRPLTEEEVAALVAFLEYVDAEQHNHLPRDYGIGLFLSGAVGAGILFILFGFAWRGRRRGSVYQEIFARQNTSSTDGQN